MHRIIRWYNQNRRRFWLTIFTAAIIVLIAYRFIYILNDNLQSTNENNTQKINTQNDYDFNAISINSNKSALTGKENRASSDELSTVNSFIQFCNSGKIEEAYSLISDDCKTLLFEDIKAFKERYYNKLFGEGVTKTVDVENWIGNTYKVDFGSNSLETGKIAKDNNIRDYITIVKADDGKYKLNIGNYITTKTIGKTSTEKNITINVIKKDIYMDYEIYTIEIVNDSDKEISLGDVQYYDTSYLKDENDLKYNAYITEIPQSLFNCDAHQRKTIEVKYFNKYSSTRNINKIVFPKVIVNNELYSVMSNKNKYINYVEIIVNF